MLHRLSKLIGYQIQARDGLIGKIHDLYFDDRDGRVVWAVVDTNRWALGHRVLISSNLLGEPDPQAKALSAGVTRDELKKAQDWNTHKPVFRELRSELNYYAPPVFGSVAGLGALGIPLIPPLMQRPPAVRPKQPQTANHLRSGREIGTYAFWGPAGKLGTIADIVVADGAWKMAYMLVDVTDGDSIRTVMAPMSSVTCIHWDHRRVVTNLTKQLLKSNPFLRFGLRPSSAKIKQLQSFK